MNLVYNMLRLVKLIKGGVKQAANPGLMGNDREGAPIDA